MSSIKSERRRHPRREGVLPLKISKKGQDVITETRNISSSGVYCCINKPLPLMSKVDLTLFLPIHSADRINTARIKCSGVVVRTEPVIVQESEIPCQNIAIFFTDISRQDKEKLNQYVVRSSAK